MVRRVPVKRLPVSQVYVEDSSSSQKNKNSQKIGREIGTRGLVVLYSTCKKVLHWNSRSKIILTPQIASRKWTLQITNTILPEGYLKSMKWWWIVRIHPLWGRYDFFIWIPFILAFRVFTRACTVRYMPTHVQLLVGWPRIEHSVSFLTLICFLYGVLG